MKTKKKYVPAPVDCGHIAIPEDVADLIERLAKNIHDIWAMKRLEDGWQWGPERCDVHKMHPCLIDYHELPESEKSYDRAMATETIKVIVALGFRLEKQERDHRDPAVNR